MIQKYQLRGMTCKGCLRIIHSAMSEIDDVLDVGISFKDSIATIKLEKYKHLVTFEAAGQKKSTKYDHICRDDSP